MGVVDLFTMDLAQTMEYASFIVEVPNPTPNHRESGPVMLMVTVPLLGHIDTERLQLLSLSRTADADKLYWTS